MGESKGNVFHDCLVMLLRPVVKFCLKRSLKIQDILEATKVAFLQLAEEELSARKEEVSMSRLSVMSGIHRRDVMRLWRDESPPKDKGSVLTRVIGQWQSDKRFAAKNGEPKLLNVEGKSSEFVQLCESVSQDLNPYTVLFELERLGIAKRVGEKLQLGETVYVPKGDPLEGMGLLSQDLGSLIRAVEENVFDDPEHKNLHVRTEYDNVITRAIPEIKKWCMEEGVKFHNRAREFLSQFDKDIHHELSEEKGGAKVVLGTFSVVEKLPKDT